ncbi:MAG: hypothetical protein U5L09_18975 [Bacteroidales bacterium]|nr:hypothetical protein [Bacteroidales bacterium]
MGSGSDIALDAADIALMHSDLQHLADAFTLSQAINKKIRRNIVTGASFLQCDSETPGGGRSFIPCFRGIAEALMIAGGAMAFRLRVGDNGRAWL